MKNIKNKVLIEQSVIGDINVELDTQIELDTGEIVSYSDLSATGIKLTNLFHDFDYKTPDSRFYILFD